MAKRKLARKIATGDCETWPFKFGRIPQALIWDIFDGENHNIFYDVAEMVEFLKDKKWIVYFHNGGKFDYHFMLDYLEPYEFILDINGRLAKFKIGECEFRDSYNLLPVPLAAYKKDDFDYTKLEPNVWKKHLKDITKYLMNDCEFLYELVDHFIDEYGVNITLASAAFKYFNKHFSDQLNEKTNKLFYDDFSPYYYGGRVECFEKGIINKAIKLYDINSAYPEAMLHFHPFGNVYEELSELPKNNIERCFIELNCISKGAFPFREKGESLQFPRDDIKRNYTITGWEYLEAINQNALSEIEIIKVTRFINKITFKNYVYHFYELKNNAEKGTPEYLIAKLFLNSLYGKYAANPEKYKETYICPEELINHSCDILEMEYAGQLGKWAILERDLPEEKQNYINVATAASITGYVRAKLFKAISESEGVVYCDTDSIFCEKSHVALSDKLGDWDLEGEFISGGIAGKKLYCFIDAKGKYKFASKGARLLPEEILKVCEGEEINYQSIAPTFSLKKDVFFLERNIKIT